MKIRTIRGRAVLYGGSFNPIHNGHIEAIQMLLDRRDTNGMYYYNKVIVAPSFASPFKEFNVCFADRFEMAATSIKRVIGDERVEVIFDSNASPLFQYTYYFLKHLSLKYSDYSIDLAIGADCLAQITKWACFKDILYQFDIVVIPREGVEMKVPEGLTLARSITKMSEIPSNISSTYIRQCIDECNPEWKTLVPKYVADYIQKHHLYDCS